MGGEEEVMDEAPVEEGDETAGPMDEVKESVQAQIDACMTEIDEGMYQEPNEVYDAVIAKMEALKEGEMSMGGLGEVEDEGMALPEDMPGEEE